MEDYRQSDAYCSYFEKRKWIVEQVGTTNVLIKKIPLLGSIIIIHRGSVKTSLSKIEDLVKKHKGFVLFFEPNITTEEHNYAEYQNTLYSNGYKDFNFNLSPTKTLINDLSASANILLSRFNQDIRKNLSLNSTKDITFALTENFEEFYPLLKQAGKYLDIYIQNFEDWKDKWACFKGDIKMLTASLSGEIVGGNMFIIKPPKAYGIFLPITTKGRNEHIASSLLWEGFKIAKKNGCTEFDLNGIYDERFKSPIKWLGLSAFKKKFRGHEVEFMPPKIKIYSALLKPLEKLKILWVFFVNAS